MEISFPYKIDLRPYQYDIWDYMEPCSDGKRAMQVWHRRAGKDLCDLQIMAKEAAKIRHNYWFILPFYQQVRKAIWEGKTKDGQPYLSFIPDELIRKKNKQEMYIELINGSIIRFLGGDNPDSLVGAGPRGIVISEWALQKPSLWNFLEPMLLENNGWAIFNTTPRGDNHAKEMFEAFKKNPNYYTSILTINDTGIVSKEAIDKLRNEGWPEEMIQQEFFCSFEGSVHGAYYGDLINDLDKRGNITSVPLDGQAMVHTFWDLGLSDMTSIWFVQFIGKEIRVIDYYEDHNKRVSDYADMLLNVKQYQYGSHNIPHDGSKRDFESLKSYQQILTEAGLKNVKVHSRTPSVHLGIMKTRAMRSRWWFDKEKCKDGLWCLKNYRRAYDEERRSFKDVPEHDLASHGADAFRLLAETLGSYEPKGNVVSSRAGMHVMGVKRFNVNVRRFR